MNGVKMASPGPYLSDNIIGPFDVLECGAQEIDDASAFPPPTAVATGQDTWQLGIPKELRDHVHSWYFGLSYH